MVDEAVVCPKCGCSVAPKRAPDEPSIWFTLLGVFFPLVGLILYLVMKDETPLRAKSAGKGALIGVCISVGLSILVSMLYVFLVFVIMSPWFLA